MAIKFFVETRLMSRKSRDIVRSCMSPTLYSFLADTDKGINLYKEVDLGYEILTFVGPQCKKIDALYSHIWVMWVRNTLINKTHHVGFE